MVTQDLYKILVLGAILIIVALFSFDKKTKFYKKWIVTLLPIIVTSVIFLFWDLKFAEAGVWKFNFSNNPLFTFYKFPLEEVLFLFTFPFLGFFIYEYQKTRIKWKIPENIFVLVNLVLLLVFALVTYFNNQKMYTFTTFLFTSAYLGYTIFRNKFKQSYSKFYFTYLVTLIPYFLYTKLLLPSTISDIHPNHILGISILNIPIENFMRYYLLLLMNFTIYEYILFKRRS